ESSSPAKILLIAAGSSLKQMGDAMSASRTGSRSKASAATSRRAGDQRGRCDGGTLPTWLDRTLRPGLGKPPRSGEAISRERYQLNSTIEVSSPAMRSAAARPAAVPLVWKALYESEKSQGHTANT